METDSRAEAARLRYLGTGAADAIPWIELKECVRDTWRAVVDDCDKSREWMAGMTCPLCFPEHAPAPIRVPFSDAQIEEMGSAALKASFRKNMTWSDIIRAALAAGGLEPCPAPKGVPSVGELVRIYRDAFDACECSGEKLSAGCAAIRDAVLASLPQPTPIASAETLEQLAEIGRAASDERHNYLIERFISAAELEAELDLAFTTAIVRAARARVDIDAAAFGEHIKHDPMSIQSIIDFCNANIVYGVQLPEPIHCGPTQAEAEAKWKDLVPGRQIEYDRWAQWLLPQLPTERAEMLSARDLTVMIRESAAKANCPYSNIISVSDLVAPELLTALAPFLRTPTGWELDVDCAAAADWLENHRGDGHFRSWLKSRIRPTFECKECAAWKLTYERDKAGWRERSDRARAALEG